jgi:lysophospholipase L1-like esterase
MKTALVPLTFLLVGLFVSAVTPLPAAPPTEGKIICFGDSITAAKTGWVSLLARKNTALVVVNAGRPGRKTSDKVQLLPILQANKDAAMVIIFLGVNDLKNADEAQIAGCVTNMEWMVGQIRATLGHPRIVILAPSNINLATLSAGNVKKQYNDKTQAGLQELESRYRDLAQRLNTGFISLFHVVSPENYLDGLHPNQAGAQQIADAVWAGL